MFQFIFDVLLLSIENSFYEDRKYLVSEQIVLCFFFDESDKTTKATKRTLSQNFCLSARLLVCSSSCLFVVKLRQIRQIRRNDNYEHAPKRQFAPLSACPLVCSSARLLVCSSACLLVCSSVRPLVCSSASPLVCSSVRLFIPFITLFTQQKKQHPEGCCFAINCLLIELVSKSVVRSVN